MPTVTSSSFEGLTVGNSFSNSGSLSGTKNATYRVTKNVKIQ